MMPQQAVTLLATISPGREPALRQQLEAVAAAGDEGELMGFGVLRHCLHFARLLLLDAVDSPSSCPARLVLLANIDGDSDLFLQQLVDLRAPGLDALFGCCEGYPADAMRNGPQRLAYLKACQVPASAFYINTIGRSARQIRQESELRDAIARYLDGVPVPTGVGAVALRQQIREFVFGQPALGWARQPRQQPADSWLWKEKLRFVGGSLVLAVLALVLSPLLIWWLLLIRSRESTDAVGSGRASLAHIEAVRAREDHRGQNPFSAVGFLKPGKLRLITVRVTLALAQFALRHVFNKGNLAGIKLPFLELDGVFTIHFARWVMIDDNRRLLFASNYDGSLESYMVDFVDKVAWGLNLVFSNGREYPATRWLVLDGARDEQQFKDFISRRQVITQVWYSGYPHLTAINIANNEKIREGLYGDMSESEACQWLQRL